MIPDGAIKSKELPLAQQFAAAERILDTLGCVSKENLERLRTMVHEAPPGPSPRLSQFLVAQGLCSSLSAAELDTILEYQPHFPDFILLKKLGAGGMGTVFLAQTADGSKVALKTLNPRLAGEDDFVQRFHREAEQLSKLSHPNLARVISSGRSNNHLYLALEYISGPSLLDQLKQHKRIPEAYAVRIMSQVAQGLHHAWTEAHLVHRDIKPENILVVRKGGSPDPFPSTDEARLIDFGLVKPIVSNDEDRLRLTQSGMTIGTPLYMAPEQIRGETLDCRCDMYAIGATLYHLVTGLVPYSGTSPGAIMSAHLTEKIPDPGKRVAELTQTCRDIIMRCMAKNPAERFSDLDELAHSMNQLKDGTGMRFLRKPMPKRAVSSGILALSANDVQAPSAITVPLPQLPNLPSTVIQTPPVATTQPPSRRTPLPVAQAQRAGVAQATPVASPALRNTPSGGSPITPAPGQRHTPAQGVAMALTPMSSPTISPYDLPKRPVAPRSNVFDEEATSHGIGLLPWIILGVAVLALVVFLLMHFL